jgi:putative phosphoesterase
MVRIAVFSDTHGSLLQLPLVRAQLGQVDWLLHAGDYHRDAAPLAAELGVPADRVRAVVGNCDYHMTDPTHALVEIGGVRILLTHGHLYGVKHTLDRIYYKAREAQVRVAVFGHSHVPVSIDDGGVLLLNPGSLTAPRVATDGPTCAILEIGEGQVRARILHGHG